MTKLEQKLKEQSAKLNQQIDTISADEGLLKKEEGKLETLKQLEFQTYQSLSIEAAKSARGALQEIDSGLYQEYRNRKAEREQQELIVHGLKNSIAVSPEELELGKEELLNLRKALIREKLEDLLKGAPIVTQALEWLRAGFILTAGAIPDYRGQYGCYAQFRQVFECHREMCSFFGVALPEAIRSMPEQLPRLEDDVQIAAEIEPLTASLKLANKIDWLIRHRLQRKEFANAS
jgi:hypothetical protein